MSGVLPYYSTTDAGYTVYRKNTAVYLNLEALSNLPGAPTSNWSTILYELLPDVNASSITTATKFYTLRDARGLLGQDYRGLPPSDSNFAPGTFEVSTPSFSTNFIARQPGGKTTIFSLNSPSNIQIANLYGSPLYEGSATIAGAETRSVRTGQMSTIGTSTFMNNLLVNRELVYNYSVVSSMYMGNRSTINYHLSTFRDGSYNAVWSPSPGTSNQFINSIVTGDFTGTVLTVGQIALPIPGDPFGEYWNSFYDIDISGIFIAYGLGGGGNFNDTYNDVTFNDVWIGCDTVTAVAATVIYSSTFSVSNIIYSDSAVEGTSNSKLYTDSITLTPDPGNDLYAIKSASTYTKIVRGQELNFVSSSAGLVGKDSNVELCMSTLILSNSLIQSRSNICFISTGHVSAPSTFVTNATITNAATSSLIISSNIQYGGSSLILSNVPISDIGGRLQISSIVASGTVAADITNTLGVDSLSTSVSSATFVDWISTARVEDALQMSAPSTVTHSVSSLQSEINLILGDSISTEYLAAASNIFETSMNRFLLPQDMYLNEIVVSTTSAATVSTGTIYIDQSIRASNITLPNEVRASTLFVSSLRSEAESDFTVVPTDSLTVGTPPQTGLSGGGQGLYVSTSNDVGATVTGLSTPENPFRITNSLVANQPHFYVSLSNTDPCVLYYTLTPLDPQTPLVILSAWYGILNNQYGADVTALVQNYAVTQPTLVVANSNFGGDPTPEFTSPKYLFLSYKAPNTNDTINASYIEGTTITFANFGSSIMTIEKNLGSPEQIDMTNSNFLRGSFEVVSQNDAIRFTFPVNNALHVRISMYLLEPGSNYLDPTQQICMNNAVLRWENAVSSVTIDNQFNDMAIRNIQYFGQLNQISDERQKEDIVEADLDRCVDILREIPLQRFRWCDEYTETWLPRDRHVLGVMAPDVSAVFPHAIVPATDDRRWATVDSEQLEMAHIGATKRLQERIAALEGRLGRMSSRPLDSSKTPAGV
jgi:Chaperone of endosialidase